MLIEPGALVIKSELIDALALTAWRPPAVWLHQRAGDRCRPNAAGSEETGFQVGAPTWKSGADDGYAAATRGAGTGAQTCFLTTFTLMQVLNRPTCTEREFWEGAAKNTFHMTLLRHSHPGRCRRGSGYNLLDHPSDI